MDQSKQSQFDPGGQQEGYESVSGTPSNAEGNPLGLLGIQ